MRVLILICCVVVWSFPVLAQGGAENEIVPEGRRGRITLEQGRPLALRQIPGEIIATDVERENSRLYYEYTIRTADGSVYEVEINAQTAKIYEIEVEGLSAAPYLPEGVLSVEAAENVALSHVRRTARSTIKTRVQASQLTAFNRKLAYSVELKQSARRYRVVVDAMDASVLDSEKMR